jgi:hypothetical protein
MKQSWKLVCVVSGIAIAAVACNTGTNTSSNLTNADSTVVSTDRTSNGTVTDTVKKANDSVKPTSVAH